VTPAVLLAGPTTCVSLTDLVAFSPLGSATGTRAYHAVASPILEICLRSISLTHGESVTPSVMVMLFACCKKRLCSLVPSGAFRAVEVILLFSVLPALTVRIMIVEDNTGVDLRSALGVALRSARSCLTWPDCCFSYVHQSGWIGLLPLTHAESWYPLIHAESWYPLIHLESWYASCVVVQLTVLSRELSDAFVRRTVRACTV
jgi:hypothetical protein